MERIEKAVSFLQGDLTDMDVDAIVNAANNDLQLGGESPGQSGAKVARRFNATVTRSVPFPLEAQRLRRQGA